MGETKQVQHVLLGKKEEGKKIPRRSQCIRLNGKRNDQLFRRLLTARRPNQRS